MAGRGPCPGESIEMTGAVCSGFTRVAAGWVWMLFRVRDVWSSRVGHVIGVIAAVECAGVLRQVLGAGGVAALGIL